MFKRKKKVLFIDDNPGIRETSSFILSGWGLDVIVAEDGKKALEKVEDSPPDLIILDVKIPEINGFDLCKLFKADHRTKDIPIILLTGMGKTREVDEGFHCGADEYMVKPVDWERLRVKVSKFLKLKN